MIKTIIFDFGDVFINLDKPATERELYKLGIKELTPDMFEVAFKYEMGLITSNEFVSYFTNKFPSINTSDLIAAWNAIILDFPEYRLQFIEQLAKDDNYQLILLSNTNELHIEKVIENMTIKRYNRFKACFDPFYLSHEIHFRKPNEDIYQFVLNKNNLNSEECLFIDDTKDNTDTASKLGIHVWNLIPGQDDVINLFTVKKGLF